MCVALLWLTYILIIDILEKIGIRGTALDLLNSYLSNRSQSTSTNFYNRKTKTVETIQSEFQKILLGVPQGSILGPLLFLIYINNLALATKHTCVMFADDATIYIPQNKLKQAEFEKEITITLENIAKSLDSLNLTININKTKIIQFRNYQTPPLQLNIVHNNIKVAEVSESKFLGVTIDCHLSWKQHIAQTNTKVSKYIFALSILSNISSKEIAKNAYYGHVYPHLTYGIIFWGNSVDVISTFKLQKRCLRAIYKLRSTDSVRNVFKENELLTLTGIFILEICLFVKNNKSYFFTQKSVRSESLRPKHKFNINIPQVNNAMFYRSSYMTAINTYNDLPLHIKLLEGKNFKKTLKKWLIEKTFYDMNEFYACTHESGSGPYLYYKR